jgi:heme-degrading monooxygenase HmoA
MSSLSESLDPPYYSATMQTLCRLPHGNFVLCTDDMIPLATRQSGFLGLETANDTKGRPVIITYWQNNSDIENWKNASLDAHGTCYLSNQNYTDYSWIKVNKVRKKPVKTFPLSTFCFLQTKFGKYQMKISFFRDRSTDYAS